MTANSASQSFSNRISGLRMQRGLVFGAIIIFALIAFEIFNFSTTQFALEDLLGDLSFYGLAWATVLAIAFCGIDFAGIARLFTPEEGANEPKEVWYLFGAWLLAATMNAMLTWWGVSIALLGRQSAGTAVVEGSLLLKVVPIFVAVMVWLIRVLIIGTFSVAGERLFTIADQKERAKGGYRQPIKPLPMPAPAPRPMPTPSANFRPAPKSAQGQDNGYSRPEPTYVPMQAAPPPPANRGASFSSPDGQSNNRR